MQTDSYIDPLRSLSWSRWLLASLLLSLLVLPLFEGLFAGQLLVLAGQTLILIVAAITIGSKLRILALTLLVLVLPMGWATLFVDSAGLLLVHCLLGSLFFWIVGIGIVFVVIKTATINLDSVLAASSAYLLFGLAWALSYWAIYAVLPGEFPADELRVDQATDSPFADFSQFIYYSFVTMSTLGYGDITPEGRVTRTLSWVQSVTGQFYVAVVIAWLVSALPRPGVQTT